MKATNFAPGPSELLPGVRQAALQAFDKGLPGWSHRSPEFVSVVSSLNSKLRQYLDLPADWSVYYVASGSQAMDLCVRNLVRERCAGVDLGAFSRRFLDIASQSGRALSRLVLQPGEGFYSRAARMDVAALELLNDSDWQNAEAWLLCHNETATGVSLPLMELGDATGNRPLRIVDCVSSAGALRFDWTRADAWFFGVQKAFGCPPGLGAILVGPRARRRAEELEAEGGDTGGWYSFSQLEENAVIDQTPCTPNTLGLAMFEGAVSTLLEKGIDAVHAETLAKRELLINWLDDHPLLMPAIAEERDRSATVMAIRFREAGDPPALLKALKAKGILLGGGYGEWKQTSFRIACFPAQDLESIAELTGLIDRELGL